MRTLLILLHKEFLLFRRDRFLPKIAFIFPCMVILIIPLVATMDVRHVGVAVVCHDHSDLARDVVSHLDASDYFSVTSAVNYDAAMKMVEEGDVDVILEIPHGFQKDLAGGAPRMHISANGVNGIKGMLGGRYVSAAVMQTVAQYIGADVVEPVTVSYFYNTTLEYRNYMIPALMIMLLIMLCGFLPALNLVSEKETGTIEQINVTPVKTSVFVLSKVVPYWIIGLIVLSAAMLLAAVVYGLRPVGSVAAIYLAAVLFIFVMSGIGIVIANFSRTMSQSMFLTLFIVLVFVLMSGLLTPIDSMPFWAQCATYAIPPRYFIDIIRSVYLKGAFISELWMDYSALVIFSLLTNAVAIATYTKHK